MMTGRCMAAATIATAPDPTLARMVPLLMAPEAPMKTLLTSCMGIAGLRLGFRRRDVIAGDLLILLLSLSLLHCCEMLCPILKKIYATFW